MTMSKKPTNNPIKKWMRDINRYFFKEDIQLQFYFAAVNKKIV